MTYCEWEAKLLGYLKSLPENEKNEITEYYREMYGDKSDAGMTNEQIIAEFGEAKVCAARILMESAHEAETEEKDATDKEKSEQKQPKTFSITVPEIKVPEWFKNISPAKAIGWFFLTVLVIIPLASIAVSVIAVFAAAAISGAAMIIGGAVIALLSPFGLIGGYTGAGALATAGIGLAAAGVGAVIAVIFFLMTKYSAWACWKLSKAIFKRRDTK